MIGVGVGDEDPEQRGVAAVYAGEGRRDRGLPRIGVERKAEVEQQTVSDTRPQLDAAAADLLGATVDADLHRVTVGVAKTRL